LESVLTVCLDNPIRSQKACYRAITGNMWWRSQPRLSGSYHEVARPHW